MRSRAGGAGAPHRALLYAERDEFPGCVRLLAAGTGW